MIVLGGWMGRVLTEKPVRKSFGEFKMWNILLSQMLDLELHVGTWIDFKSLILRREKRKRKEGRRKKGGKGGRKGGREERKAKDKQLAKNEWSMASLP